MLPPDSTLYHVRHPFRPSRFLCMWALVFPLATRDFTKNQAQDVRALRVVWSVVVPFIMPNAHSNRHLKELPTTNLHIS